MKLTKIFLKYVLPVIILVIALNITQVTVTDSKTGQPVSFAKVGFFNTDINGKCSFLDAVFTTKLSVSRIGYENSDFNVPFGVLFKKIDIPLTEAPFNEIYNQISNYGSSLDNYQYVLESSDKQAKSATLTTITAKKDGKDFYFKMAISDNTGTKSTVAIVKGNDMYKSQNGEPLVGPLSEQDKQDFEQTNIVFVSIQDVLASALPSDEPSSISFDKNSLIMKWGDSETFNLIIGEKGAIEKIAYTETNSPIQREGSLSISSGGITISVDENG
ncbi:MAG: hypothetical protein ACP5SB_03695 [Caldisericaceae bacterium]